MTNPIVVVGGEPNDTVVVTETINNPAVQIQGGGPKGDPGPQGPPGPATARFTYNQINSQAIWVVHHSLNTFPTVTVLDSAGNEVVGDVAYSDPNNLTISFSTAFSGTAYLL